MKKILILLLSAALLVSCNLPFIGSQSTPEKTEVPATEAPVIPTAIPLEPQATATLTETPLQGTEINLGGVYMILPACLPAAASGQIVAAQVPDPNGGPMSIWPEHRQINLTGYPLSGKFWEPSIRVFPVAEYTSMWEYSGEQVAALRNLINTQPADVAESLPFLPNLGAAQVFHDKIRYLNFQNGSGVRFLTEYAQYSAPYNNNDLFYTFQGLTSDDKYWISAVFPVNHAILPPTYDSTEVPPGGLAFPLYTSSTWETDLQAYYVNMKVLMESLPDETFIPGVDCLDQYISSLNIGD